jgi:hypothetical protein
MHSYERTTFYLVTFRDPKDGSTTQLKVTSIEDSSLGLSFIKISEFLFETGSLVVSPTEEQLQKRFENVKSLHLSIYNIISIEEIGVEHKGLIFDKDRSNLISFPSDFGAPPPGS